MYEVHLSQRADRFLNKLDNHIRERITDGLKKLAPNPVPKDAKFMMKDSGNSVFRHRIGDYRAMYKVIEDKKIVLVTKVDKRPRVYHR